MTADVALAADVGCVDVDGVVYLGLLPRGPILVLDGTAAELWRAWREAGTADLAARTARRFGVDVAQVQPHLDAFFEDLVARGVLRRA